MINSRENKVAQGNAYHTTLYSWAVNNVLLVVMISMDFLGGSAVKNLPASAGDTSSIPAYGRSPGEGKGNPLQYSYLGNPMDRGAWWAMVHRVSRSQT